MWHLVEALGDPRTVLGGTLALHAEKLWKAPFSHCPLLHTVTEDAESFEQAEVKFQIYFL